MKLKIIFYSFIVYILSACNAIDLINSDHNKLSVSSTPSGASVYIMGELQGETPLVINVTKLYPVTYSKENKSLYGRIALMHEGCDDVFIKVTNEMSGSTLKQNLNCIGDEIPEIKESMSSDGLVKQRLHELGDLKKEGLINEEEFQKIRLRILESL